METIMSGEFGRAFFALGTGVVLSIVWFGYYRSVFVVWLSYSVVGVLVAYMTTFLTYRYMTAHIAEHMAREANYVLIASLHGTVSLLAVALTVYLFIRGARAYARDFNYFKMHPLLTGILIASWPAALLSGLFL